MVIGKDEVNTISVLQKIYMMDALNINLQKADNGYVLAVDFSHRYSQKAQVFVYQKREEVDKKITEFIDDLEKEVIEE